jgi:5'-nucleotidase
MAGAAMLAGSLGLPISADAAGSEVSLTILHTNDVHSRIDPFPMDGGRNQGLGGVAARAEIIKRIRRKQQHVLLLDAGDIFQGTPYFNMYKGEPEIKAMTAMGYDACTIGNHDFDAGMENLATQLQHARFPMLVANYNLTGTPLEQKLPPYTIINKGPLKIGVFGIGIELNGLVPENLYGATKYLDPIAKANETAEILKKKHSCDLIICLSHLGYKYDGEKKVSDQALAAESHDIDLIIGGHTHTFLREPEVKKNKKGGDVVINQVGWAGIELGVLEYNFQGVKKKNFANSHIVTIGKKTSM